MAVVKYRKDNKNYHIVESEDLIQRLHDDRLHIYQARDTYVKRQIENDLTRVYGVLEQGQMLPIEIPDFVKEATLQEWIDNEKLLDTVLNINGHKWVIYAIDLYVSETDLLQGFDTKDYCAAFYIHHATDTDYINLRYCDEIPQYKAFNQNGNEIVLQEPFYIRTNRNVLNDYYVDGF